MDNEKADCQDYSLCGKVGKELSTSTVGVIGTGNIGKQLLSIYQVLAAVY